MRLTWREFRVCLPKLDDFLQANIPSADGLIATPLACYVVEKAAFVDTDKASVQAYWDGLTQDGEAAAFTQRDLAAREAQRQSLRQTLQSLLQETSSD